MNERRSGSEIWWGFFYLPAVVGLFLLGCEMAYCGLNTVGHSALDLRDGRVFFGSLGLVGVLLRRCGARRAGWVTVAVGVLGIGFGYFAHHLAVMREYNHWASHGLEPKNPHASLLLTGYAVFSVVVLACTLRRCGRQERRAAGGCGTQMATH